MRRRPPGSHKIEGIGLGFLPPLWHPNEVTEILTVSTDDAKAMARRLARDEAIFAGTSTGANIVAALRVAERLGPGKTVATLIVRNIRRRPAWNSRGSSPSTRKWLKVNPAGGAMSGTNTDNR